MLRNRCPRADKLEAFANAPDGAGRLARHVAACPTCHRIVAELREEAALIKELQGAAQAALAPAVRRKLRRIAREAVLEADPGDSNGRQA
jgi:anti-sigma factor RsiW